MLPFLDWLVALKVSDGFFVENCSNGTKEGTIVSQLLTVTKNLSELQHVFIHQPGLHLLPTVSACLEYRGRLRPQLPLCPNWPEERGDS